ncbi:MAG: DNA mismatch repair endonuclease MutL [Thermodesulfobacteriota bacterium]
MSSVQVLDDILISKIAAGEVVERPASVLKEFLENSLDAGADKISVEIDSGGKRLVRVSDNGCGMSRDDAILCIERHATSKITDESDLASIGTFGFRGEALPSIAAVSKFSLTTRTGESDTGTAIEVEGGKAVSVKDAGCPAGTTVEARSLFFNTRPRLKFLKTDETELSWCAAVARSLAVANPEVDFEVSHNGRVMFRFAPGDIESRVRDVAGNVKLYPFGTAAPEGETGISGFLCAPQGGFSSLARLYCYVNGRYVRDRFVNRILMDCFKRTFDKGRYPQGAVFITVPPGGVDVNVHPTKHEVRFISTGAVAGAVRAAVEEFLSQAPWITGGEGAPSGKAPQGGYTQMEEGGTTKTFFGEDGVSQKPSQQSFGNIPQSAAPAFPPAEQELPLSPEREHGFFSRLKIVGQAGAFYIICESRDGIVLIDQHAAHERVNFERFRNAYRENGALSAQRLLIPEIIEMRPEEMALFGRFEGKMRSMGLNAEMFGESAVRLESLPAIISCTDGKTLFIDILEEMSGTQCPEAAGELDKKTENVLATIACHKSIRAGYSMEETEIKSLLAEMDSCESPHFCPHGRPVAVNLTYGGLEKMFRRK